MNIGISPLLDAVKVPPTAAAAFEPVELLRELVDDEEDDDDEPKLLPLSAAAATGGGQQPFVLLFVWFCLGGVGVRLRFDVLSTVVAFCPEVRVGERPLEERVVFSRPPLAFSLDCELASC